MAHFNAFVILQSRPLDAERALAEATEYHVSTDLLFYVSRVIGEVSPDEAAQAVAEYKRACVVMSGEKSGIIYNAHPARIQGVDGMVSGC